MITCVNCGKDLDDMQCGYTQEHDPVCYVCCAINDSEYMTNHNKIDLYLCKHNDGWKVTNWPGSLQINVNTPKKGKHNIANNRYDVWFKFAGKFWHGVQYGDWTQICHCKVVKAFQEINDNDKQD